MAEPIGITGTAVGIVSLGLQLYTGISEYLDAVKGRDEDLQHAKQYAKTLRDYLRSIQETINVIGSDYTVARHAVEQCKSSCETELKGLEALLQELIGPLVDPTDRTKQAKSSLRKFRYPFKRKNITRLQERLNSTNNVLNMATLALQLAISNNTCTTIVGLQKTAHKMHKTTENTARGMIEQAIALKQASQTLTKSHQEIQLISQRMPKPLDSSIDEILTHLRKTESPGSRIAQLLQYPQDLRRLCDVVSNLSQSSKTSPVTAASRRAKLTSSVNATSYQLCSCATRQGFRRQGRRLGLLFYEVEVQKTIFHAPECQLSRIIPIADEKRRTVGVHIPAIFKLLSSTIRLSFSLKAGAGGFSISQSINYTTTVDENSSLSFRIAQMLIRLMNERTPGLRNEDFSIIAESCIRRLTLSYRNKQASPRDVNSHGESILDLLAWQLDLLGELMMPADVISYVLRSFATTKVLITNSSRVKVPFFIRVANSSWLSEAGTAHETIAALLACCDMPTGQDYHALYLRYTQQSQRKAFQNFPEIAENLGFNPLHMAIIKEDEEEVHHLLERYPSYINDVNYCGQSPVHIAIQTRSFPIMLAVILAANTEILNTTDNEQQYPIDMAADIACRLRERSEESHRQTCNQSRIIDLLLESNSVLLNTFIHERFDHTCQHTKIVVLGHLAKRRRGLELLAISKLSAAEIQDLGLCRGQTLDRNTARVQHYLAKRCHIPVQLLFCPEDDVAKWLGCSESIYAYIYDRDVAEYAISLGFDARTAFTDVFFHIILAIVYRTFPGNGDTFGHASFPMYVCWMIHRGADIATVVPANFAPGVVQKATWAHYLMALLGMSTRRNHHVCRALPREVAEVVSSPVIVDGCQCRCSAQGCTPLVKFLEGLDWRLTSGQSVRSLERYALRASEILESLLPRCKDGGLGDRWIYRAILRYLTFSALDLCHTCCELANEGSETLLDGEEVREFHEEDAAQPQILEELVSNFEVGCENYPDLASFLRDIWVPKMQHVCAELNSRQLTGQEIRSAEGAGVIWEICESEDTWGSEEGEYINPESWARVGGLMSQMDWTNDDAPSAVEEWMRRLDDIAIDPERPVIN